MSSGSVSWVRFLARESMDLERRSLFAQLVYQISFRIELCLRGSMRMAPKEPLSLVAKPASVLDIINNQGWRTFELL